ncbi:MAG: conserved membrane protein of unknown function [Promethearchaeota archaeon]|nr:MAG: conserved membrane protein of unknown function [Candidatus Lokiarchaeota archaeon]
MTQKKRKYICADCGNIFNEELSELIEEGIQVYCEKCGAPFNLEKTKFSEKAYKPVEKISTKEKEKKKKKHKKQKIEDLTEEEKEKRKKDYDKLAGAIKTFNKFTYIPILIYGIISFILTLTSFANPEEFVIIFIRHFTAGVAALTIALYDNRVIGKKVKAEKFEDVVLDGICFGILGSIVFGLGVLILIKGVLISVYAFISEDGQKRNLYEKGLLLKNSFCNFSSKAGYLILVLVFQGFFSGNIMVNETSALVYIRNPPEFSIIFPYLVAFCVFFTIAVISLIINSFITHKIYYRQTFDTKHGISLIILGILATMFYASGIFILIEGVLLIILKINAPDEYEDKPLAFKEKQGEPFIEEEHIYKSKEESVSKVPFVPHTEHETKTISHEKEQTVSKEEGVTQPSETPFVPQIKEKEISEEEDHKKAEEKGSQKIPFVPRVEGKELSDAKKEEIKKEISKIKEEEIPVIKDKERETELELKLHESLLPVRDKKDKKLVKEYFSKIFTVLSKDVKKQIKDLNISKKEKKEILKELAFLNKEQQINYINAMISLYKEELPDTLIARVKNLRNIKPEHLEKVVNQLKYMDAQEKVEFIIFLEKHA